MFFSNGSHLGARTIFLNPELLTFCPVPRHAFAMPAGATGHALEAQQHGAILSWAKLSARGGGMAIGVLLGKIDGFPWKTLEPPGKPGIDTHLFFDPNNQEGHLCEWGISGGLGGLKGGLRGGGLRGGAA